MCNTGPERQGRVDLMRAASGPRTVNAVRTSGGVLLTQLFQRFSQDRHRPPGIGDFVRRQKLDRFELTS